MQSSGSEPLHSHGRLIRIAIEELKFDSATDKFMVSAVAFAAELEREKASQRSRDALLRKAERGFNTGGRVYGYDNVPVYAQGGNDQPVRSHTEYRVNAAEAQVVRSIFGMYADGQGMKTIARTMNGDPAYRELSIQYVAGEMPLPPRKGSGSWAPSSIREMLYRERYLGKVPFGEHRKVLRAGSRSREKQDHYLLVDRPDLRIVDQSLWDQVQGRLRGRRQAYLAATGGEHHGRPESGRVSRYLLSGLMRCDCGGSMCRAWQRQDPPSRASLSVQLPPQPRLDRVREWPQGKSERGRPTRSLRDRAYDPHPRCRGLCG